MANSQTVHSQLDLQLQDVIHSLYALMIQAYDYRESPGSRPMISQVQNLVRNLQTLSRTSSELDAMVPAEVIAYVENGRNPDIYTREFVENVQELNQTLKGKTEAFGAFKDALASEMKIALPEIAGETDRVLEACERK